MAAKSQKAIENQKTAKAVYANSMQGKYRNHKAKAKRRGIEFLLTFEEWKELWLESGHYDEMGRGLDNYCMSRHNDTGPYAVGNVEIIKNRYNLKIQVVSGSHAAAKLTLEDIKEIKALAGIMSQSGIAKLKGLNQCHVSRILNGKRGYIMEDEQP